MTSENALADLAERLKEGLSEKFGIPDDSDRFQADVISAARIVAELAKIGYWKSTGRPHFDDAFSAVSNCRAIAEEGSGDGN